MKIWRPIALKSMHWISNPTITGDFSPSQFCHVTAINWKRKIWNCTKRSWRLQWSWPQHKSKKLVRPTGVSPSPAMSLSTGLSQEDVSTTRQDHPPLQQPTLPVYTNAKVSNIQVSTMLDTGASISLISNNMLKHLQRRQAQHSNKCSTPNCHC